MRRIERWMMNTRARAWVLRRLEAPRVLEGLHLPDRSTCLEIGCGRGAGGLCIAGHLRPGRLVCVDSDREMIAAARRYVAGPPRWARAVDARRIELVCCDATELPFAGGTFDAAFLFGALHHIRAWRNAVAEVRRVLRPGGVFSFGEALVSDSPLWFNRYWRHVPFGRQELDGALREAGFTVQTFRSALLGRWCFVRARKRPADITARRPADEDGGAASSPPPDRARHSTGERQ